MHCHKSCPYIIYSPPYWSAVSRGLFLLLHRRPAHTDIINIYDQNIFCAMVSTTASNRLYKVHTVWPRYLPISQPWCHPAKSYVMETKSRYHKQVFSEGIAGLFIQQVLYYSMKASIGEFPTSISGRLNEWIKMVRMKRLLKLPNKTTVNLGLSHQVLVYHCDPNITTAKIPQEINSSWSVMSATRISLPIQTKTHFIH